MSDESKGTSSFPTVRRTVLSDGHGAMKSRDKISYCDVEILVAQMELRLVHFKVTTFEVSTENSSSTDRQASYCRFLTCPPSAASS